MARVLRPLCRLGPALLLFLQVASTLEAQVTATCRPPGPGSAWLIDRLRKWVTTTDPKEVQRRDSVFRIPVVPPDQLVVVSDERICRRASRAYAKRLRVAPGPVHVVQMGSGSSTWYAVYDPVVGTQPGQMGAVLIDMGAVLILDRRYRDVGGWSF